MKRRFYLLIILMIGIKLAGAQGTWTRKADFPTPARTRGIGFGIGNKGYMGTGWDAMVMVHNDFWEFDPVANTWTQKADFIGTNRYGAVGFSVGNKGYVGTGYDLGNFNNDFYEYDPTTNMWTAKANFPGSPRYFATGISIGSKGYIGFGYDLHDSIQNDLWEYDPLTDVWVRKANITSRGRCLASGFSIGNKGYFGLGFDTTHNDVLNFFEFDPATNTWTQKANFAGTIRDGASSFSIGSYGYVGCGSESNLNIVLSDFWKYDPITNTWSQIPNFGGVPRDGATGFNVGNLGYVGIGSLGNNSYSYSDFWQYAPPCNSSEVPTLSTSNDNFCGGLAATLSITSGSLNNATNWYWYAGSCGGTLIDSGLSITVHPTSSTIYFARGEGGCTTNLECAAISLNVYTTPTPTITGGSVICTVGSLTLNPGNYSSYSWSTGATSQTISVGAANTYTVTVTNASGCTGIGTETVIVDQNPIPSIIGGNAFCAGSSLTLSTGSFAVYHWSNNSTTQTINVNTGGTFNVTVSNANGCTGTTSQTVNVNANPTPTISGGGAFCAGGVLTLNTGSYAGYIWSNASTTQTITINAAGNYRVTVTDGNGCTGVASQSVIVNPNPSPSITGPNFICSGSSITLNTGPYTTYNWSTGGNTQSISVSSANTYVVTVTNVFGCTGTASRNITMNTSPTPSINGITSICNGVNSTLSTGPFASYIWSDGSTTQNIIINSPNTYNVTVTDANGCTGVATHTVTALPQASPHITANGPTSFCDGGSVNLTVGSFQQYEWSNGASIQSIPVSISGTYTITVTNSSGCTGTDAMTVTVFPHPVPTINPGDSVSLCAGQTVNLMASNGYAYQWSNGQTDQGILIQTSGNYIVTVTYQGNCTAVSVPTNVIVHPLPVATITSSSNPVFCLGDTLLLTTNSSEPLTYSWSSGATTQSIKAYASGILIVTVTDTNNCHSTSSITLTGIAAPLASFTHAEFAGTVTFTNTSTNGSNYYWTFGDGGTSTLQNPTHTYTNHASYTVTLIVSNPCGADTISQTILVTGINEINDLKTTFSTYPNPAKDYLTISFKAYKEETFTIKLIDMAGKTVKIINLNALAGDNQFQMSLETIAKGSYSIQMQKGKSHAETKILIQ